MTGAQDAATYRLVHTRAIRWMHWINVPLLAVMVFSGLRIYWANDVYAFGIGSWTIVHLFPDAFFEALDLNQALARGIAFHFTFGWLFALNGLAYVIYLATSGEWRHVVPDRRALAEVGGVVLHDLGLRDEAPAQGRYNAAQQVTYTLVIVMGAFMVLTGLAILKSTQLAWLTWLLGGYQTARLLHFLTTMAFVGFFVLHLVQVARAGTENFLAMITGWRRDSRSTPDPVPDDGGPGEVDAAAAPQPEEVGA